MTRAAETPADDGRNGRLLSEVALAGAAESARRGDYEQAVRTLRELEERAGPGRAQLDLLARVQAQSGDLTAADLSWSRVLEIDESDSDALAGRAVIAEISQGRRRRKPFPVLAFVGTTAVVLLLAGGAVWIAGPGSSPEAAPPPSVHQEGPLDRAHRRIDDLESRLDDERRSDRKFPRAVLSSLAGKLDGSGVRAAPRANAVRVVFDSGLFGPDGSTLTAEGTAALDDFGSRLSGMKVVATVYGHGAAVSGGVSSGGSSVAVDRAVVAAEELSRSSGLPLTAFGVRSADQSNVPYPSGDAIKNRTVTILVAPA